MKVFWASVLMLLLHHQGFTQTDSTVKKSIDTIKVGNMVILRKDSDSLTSIKSDRDTIRVTSDVIIIGNGLDKGLEKIRTGAENLKDAFTDLNLKIVVNKQPKKYSTNWFVWDLGFAGYDDQTNYSSASTQKYLAPVMGTNFPMPIPLSKNDFALRTTRVSNFNLWFFIQRMSLIKQVVNLKYGLGIESNNYYFKSGIKYEDLGIETLVSRTLGEVHKNKLVANYLTAPLMLNINTNPSSRKNGFQISAGLSGGFLINAWQKMRIEGERSKVKSDYNLSPFKLSYIGELGLGKVRLYGSYAPKAMHQYGVNQKPYTVGVRFSY
ncbi:MAG: hypothetical protein RL634_142 [Bacteroidota bacterium]|jgi:hypothetical protein